MSPARAAVLAAALILTPSGRLRRTVADLRAALGLLGMVDPLTTLGRFLGTIFGAG